MHFSCDLCGKDLSSECDPRYVVKMEIFAAHDPCELTDEDLDDDHMEEMSRLLDENDDDEPSAQLPPAARSFRYDLCPACQKRFVGDPLGKETAQKFRFSKN